MTGETKRGFLGVLGIIGLFGSRKAASAEEPVPLMQGRLYEKFPYEVVSVEGKSALQEWARLKKANRAIPVVIGGDEDLKRLIEFLDYMSKEAKYPSPAAILEASEAIRFPEDWNKLEDAPDGQIIAEMMGQWPDGRLQDEPVLTVATDILTGKFLPRVHIALVPANASWELPAYLCWGDWNACPPPAYHVAALRTLHERYGAELVGMSGDVLNLHVPTPVANREEALQLAIAVYRYCPDIVDQGVNEVSVLAALLMKQQWWFFWWD